MKNEATIQPQQTGTKSPYFYFSNLLPIFAT